MSWYLVIKWLHILSATVLFGTGAGIALGCCWLPVVWLQIRMRDLAVDAANKDLPLPALYHLYYRKWFALGWPAFVGVLIIFYLMVAKP